MRAGRTGGGRGASGTARAAGCAGAANTPAAGACLSPRHGPAAGVTAVSVRSARSGGGAVGLRATGGRGRGARSRPRAVRDLRGVAGEGDGRPVGAGQVARHVGCPVVRLGWSPVAGSSRSGTFRAARQGSGPDAALSDTGECARAVGGEPACLREAHLGEERGEVSALRPAASSPRGPRLRIRGSGPEPGRGRREPASARDGNHRPTTVPERRGGTAAVAP